MSLVYEKIKALFKLVHGNAIYFCLACDYTFFHCLHQIRSKEQGRALGSLLKAVTDEFKEIIPQELNKIYRNITDIVLSDKIPR